MKLYFLFLTIIAGLLFPNGLFANEISVTYSNGDNNFPLVQSGNPSSLVVDSLDAEVVTVAANALSEDIKLITDVQPIVTNKVLNNYPVVIGTLGNSMLIDSLAKSGKISIDSVEGQWETFCIAVVNDPFVGIGQALVIYGSDPRGTAFGVFEFAKMLGVSPWVWWADVVPEKHTELYVTPGKSIVGPPSVQYRGIFINDEDWGLQPWAAKSFDPVKDIGPKTYEKVFELLLRVKANYIWPAMHPSTRSFNYYEDNKVVAGRYAIVMGSSHHEPLLYNTIKDWPYAASEWNPYTNLSTIMDELEKRVISNGIYENMYTLAMRGAGDAAMPGTLNEQTAKLQECIGLQRDLLTKHIDPDITKVPQVLFPYKEVLLQYNNGLNVPDDVTLGWVDDNFGYIRQLSDPDEQLRSGGSGVYYHFSYWGIPDDYLWLSSISPSLTSFEMSKAYALNAKKLWIFNVGDIKPQEMEMQFAMDLAWDVNSWTPEKAHLYSADWAAETFGNGFGESIGKIKQEYYRLAATGKPEHLASINYTEQEILQRLADYDSLVVSCNKVKAQIPSRLQDAYFQLIEYPVKGAANMNTKVLAARLSHSYAGQGREIALDFSEKATAAYDNIVALTNKYNTGIANGKWDGMMDYAPRGLSRFYEPNVASVVNDTDIPQATEDSVYVIPASGYSELSGTIKTMKGLGDQGNSLAVWPIDTTSYSASNVTSAPYAEYDVPVKKGANRITVRCLPNFPLYGSLQLRYAISIEGSTPGFFNIETSAETSPWAKNLLQGYVAGQSNYVSPDDKTIKVRVYFTDPGLVVSAITSQGIYVNDLTKRITNPNFEYTSEGIFNDGATVRGIPYGWESSGTLLGNSYGINNDGNNYSGNNLCWMNSTPMPGEFELYQVVDSLPAGEYIVRCRLAVMSDRVTNQRLFANNYVQYFGDKTNYGSNLTDGEKNTFAGWSPSASYDLKEMAVKVAVFEGDSLKLGIRSSNLKGNGTTANDNSGWFKVDHFRIESFKLFTDINDEKLSLDSLIAVAKILYDTTESVINGGLYPGENRLSFNATIQSAESVNSNQGASIADVINAMYDLEFAMNTYKGSKVDFTANIVNPDFEYKSAGVLNDGSTIRGIPYGWSKSGNLIGDSYGINDDGTNYSGNNLCWINSSPMPDEFELYQNIENLPAGEYIVRCRLAVMTDRVTNQRLFANNNVQYFGSGPDYISNLSEGETNTFANWNTSASYNLKEMEVEVEVSSGEPLKVGIRSGNLLSDGSRETSNNSGWFKVDHFRIIPVDIQLSYDTKSIESPDMSIGNTKEGFNVHIHDKFNNGNIWLYSITGNLILHKLVTSSITEVSVPDPGIYVVKVMVDKKIMTKKLSID